MSTQDYIKEIIGKADVQDKETALFNALGNSPKILQHIVDRYKQGLAANYCAILLLTNRRAML